MKRFLFSLLPCLGLFIAVLPLSPALATARHAVAQPPPIIAPPTDSASIIQRAQSWVINKVPYNSGSYYLKKYRQDCSGFVSMAWGNVQQYDNKSRSYVAPDTVSLIKNFILMESLDPDYLQPGDILDNGLSGLDGHVVIFAGWADPRDYPIKSDKVHLYYYEYEEAGGYTKGEPVASAIPKTFPAGFPSGFTEPSYLDSSGFNPGTFYLMVPYPYWSGSGTYLPYRYKNLVAPPPTPTPTPIPTPTPVGGTGGCGTTSGLLLGGALAAWLAGRRRRAA